MEHRIPFFIQPRDAGHLIKQLIRENARLRASVASFVDLASDHETTWNQGGDTRDGYRDTVMQLMDLAEEARNYIL